MDQQEAQTIYQELAESFDISLQLQRMDGIAYVGKLFGRVLFWAGQLQEALNVLEHAATAFEKLQHPQQVEEIRNLQKQIREQME
jgi:aromatic ring-cleaving dioxygenase